MELNIEDKFREKALKAIKEEESRLTEEQKEKINQTFEFLCELVLSMTKEEVRETVQKDLELAKTYSAIEKRTIISETVNSKFIFNFIKSLALSASLRGDKLLWLKEECSPSQS